MIAPLLSKKEIFGILPKSKLLCPDMFNAPGNFFQFESIIPEASKGLVHHMMLYGCYDATPPRPIGTQWNCYDDGTNMPSSMCTTAIFGWTIGSGVRSCYTHFQTLIFKALS